MYQRILLDVGEQHGDEGRRRHARHNVRVIAHQQVANNQPHLFFQLQVNISHGDEIAKLRQRLRVEGPGFAAGVAHGSEAHEVIEQTRVNDVWDRYWEVREEREDDQNLVAHFPVRLAVPREQQLAEHGAQGVHGQLEVHHALAGVEQRLDGGGHGVGRGLFKAHEVHVALQAVPQQLDGVRDAAGVGTGGHGLFLESQHHGVAEETFLTQQRGCVEVDGQLQTQTQRTLCIVERITRDDLERITLCHQRRVRLLHGDDAPVLALIRAVEAGESLGIGVGACRRGLLARLVLGRRHGDGEVGLPQLGHLARVLSVGLIGLSRDYGDGPAVAHQVLQVNGVRDLQRRLLGRVLRHLLLQQCGVHASIGQAAKSLDAGRTRRQTSQGQKGGQLVQVGLDLGHAVRAQTLIGLGFEQGLHII